MQSIYNINLHFNQAVAQKTGHVFKAGDKGISFALNVVDLDPDGMTPKIVFHRSDGTSVESSSVTNVGRVYSYTTLGNEFAIPGVLVADLKFYDGDSQRVSTSSFIMGVISDTLDGLGGGTGGYSDELEQLREQMEQAAENLDDMSDEFADTLQDYIDAFGNTAPINPCGAYSALTEYHPRDAVTYTVSSKELTYINRRTCTGIAPDDPDDGATYWQVLIDVSGSGAFSALSDVSIDSQTLANDQVAVYDSTTQKWKNKTIFENNLTSTATDKALTAAKGKELEDNKQPKTLSSAITVAGTSQTTVEGALGAINTAKQGKELDTAITIGGVERTTVEGALGALNTEVSGLTTIVVSATFKNTQANTYEDTGITFTAQGGKLHIVGCSWSSGKPVAIKIIAEDNSDNYYETTGDYSESLIFCNNETKTYRIYSKRATIPNSANTYYVKRFNI